MYIKQRASMSSFIIKNMWGEVGREKAYSSACSGRAVAQAGAVNDRQSSAVGSMVPQRGGRRLQAATVRQAVGRRLDYFRDACAKAGKVAA